MLILRTRNNSWTPLDAGSSGVLLPTEIGTPLDMLMERHRIFEYEIIPIVLSTLGIGTYEFR